MRQKESMKEWMTRLELVVEKFQNGNYANLAYFRILRRQPIENGTWSFMKDVPCNVLDEVMKKLQGSPQKDELIMIQNLYGPYQQQWTFIWIYEKEVTPRENQTGGITVCSLDPGVRKFYIGNQDAQRIIRLCLHLDDLISRTIKARANKRSWEISGETNFKGRRVGKGVKIVGEAYTSETCGFCEWINQNLGGRKVFKCGKCGLCIYRDINGARGIFLRALLDGTILL
ncbi:4676_t:CDS:2 [Diversispora eburnea]|uniref:4676_t:CDS:1 n=1 Tax=Diversispora eburnea TaxID=1213867 RepID=A0A9N8V8Z2_9GLOM|nr:4676_t:CDS:2 [Diversispora eburnea]